jgi:hypothetical protein
VRPDAASEHTRMACYRTAIDSHAAKRGCSGAGGAGAAEGRVVSGAASEQTRVMWSEQIEMIACRSQVEDFLGHESHIVTRQLGLRTSRVPTGLKY